MLESLEYCGGGEMSLRWLECLLTFALQFLCMCQMLALFLAKKKQVIFAIECLVGCFLALIFPPPP